jgi:hypothetical protein
MADDIPAPLPETGILAPVARAVNQLSKAVRKRQLKARPGQKIHESPNGTSLEVQGGGGSTVFTQDWFY